jgi:antitoxin ParD1/3/4
MSAQGDDPLFTPDEEARVQRRIRERGMTFEVFLPEGMADWLRGKLVAGKFESPAEAAFVAFQQMMELDRHPEVKRQLLAATIQSSIDDPRPSVPADEAFARLRARMRELAASDTED